MTNSDVSARELAERLLAGVDRKAWRIVGSATQFTALVNADEVAFDVGSDRLGFAYEQLAAIVEARIAHDRAGRMLAAVPPSPTLPLWLVCGSDVLARWLSWSGTGNALAKTLQLSDAVGAAPIHGELARRARRGLGQGGARIRIRQGVATAEWIELSETPAASAVLGTIARIRVEASMLPETLLVALHSQPLRNARRSLSEIIDHPFVAAADLMMIGAVNDGSAVVFELENHSGPLASVPPQAWAVLPQDADLACPWRVTAREMREHDHIVQQGRRLSGRT